MTIKTWRDRLEEQDDGHITTHADVQGAMLTEIDELRAAGATDAHLLELAQDTAKRLCDERDALKAELAALKAQPVQEPVMYQARMRPNWKDDKNWLEWALCSALAAADYERKPLLHDWEYQVRKLYAAPVQPALTDAGQCDGLEMGPNVTRVFAEPQPVKQAECKHTNGYPGWTSWNCSDCGAIKHDGTDKWVEGAKP